MADLTPHNTLPTIRAIFDLYESRPQTQRPHLGASQIGHHCDRYLWYQFHWCDSPSFDGRMLRLFDHGNAEEDRLIRDMRRAGFTVWSHDLATGRQFTFTAFGGHFGCSLDGVIQDMPESAKPHLLEVKTASAKRFAQLQKSGLADWSPQYLAQVVVGMELADLERTLHVTVCKDNDALYGERVKANPKEAKRLLNRAERVIFSEDPLERISDRPDWYQCKFCDMRAICHGQRVAEVNCRTCLHSTAQRDGTWHCARHDKILSVDVQRSGCANHLMRPQLVPYASPEDAGDDWVRYDNDMVNHCGGSEAGRHCYTSHELRAAERPLPLDDEAEAARLEFTGTVEAHRDPA